MPFIGLRLPLLITAISVLHELRWWASVLLDCFDMSPDQQISVLTQHNRLDGDLWLHPKSWYS